MESLKKTIAIVMLLVVCGVSASAQVSPSKIFETIMQRSFRRFQGAINDLVGLNGFAFKITSIRLLNF